MKKQKIIISKLLLFLAFTIPSCTSQNSNATMSDDNSTKYKKIVAENALEKYAECLISSRIKNPNKNTLTSCADIKNKTLHDLESVGLGESKALLEAIEKYEIISNSPRLPETLGLD